jgi:hypothetical protein
MQFERNHARIGVSIAKRADVEFVHSIIAQPLGSRVCANRKVFFIPTLIVVLPDRIEIPFGNAILLISQEFLGRYPIFVYQFMGRL